MNRLFTLASLAAVIFGLLVSAQTVAFAQALNSSIAGVAKDASGGVLPGVTVEASSPALIEKTRTVTTDGDGLYKIVALPTGSFTITFSLAGFNTVRRDGVELMPNFTATINADMKVGALQETVTVTGASPTVDVQNLTQRQVLSATLLDSVPVQKNIAGFAALTPTAIIPATAQDVGGAAGELSVRITVNGSKQEDGRLMWDGFLFNQVGQTGTQRGYFVNPAAAQDVVVQLPTAGSAESPTGGSVVDTVPKDGGNHLTGYVFSNYAGHSFQGDNLTPALIAQGLKTPNSIDNLYDVQAAVGGPLMKDRLWFYQANRYWQRKYFVANLFSAPTQGVVSNGFAYLPDPSRPAEGGEWYDMHSLRLTWQVSAKDKINLHGEYQHAWNGNAFTTGTVAWEAATGNDYHRGNLYQIAWTRTATSKLLLQGGLSVLQYGYATALPGLMKDDGVVSLTNFSCISITDSTRGLTYNCPSSYTNHRDPQQNGRLSLTYVTGAHALKFGMLEFAGYTDATRYANNAAVSYTFLNGVPSSITEFASPLTTHEVLKPDLILFGQDQWTRRRLTVSYGLLFDYLHAYVPALSQPAGVLVAARSYPAVECVPCWKDLSPRFGVAYDLFGNGRTAVKVGFGRYLAGMGNGNAQQADPSGSLEGPAGTPAINTVNRSWTDANRNFVPDCTLTDPAANGECGAIANTNFGVAGVVNTQFDPATQNGWGKRGYNWTFATSIQHELRPGASVSVGYHRVSYHNFLVADNTLVTPADYDPYCVTAPVNAQLPGGGGNQICGLYDLNPAKFGRVNNVFTSASTFGTQTEIYNGVDAAFNVRLPRQGLVSGGFNIGNSVAFDSTFSGTSSARNNCFVVDSPQQLYQCNQATPYQKQFKALISYPLLWDLQASANIQSLPGPVILATWAAPVASITPSLGRVLSGGARSATISLITPGSAFQNRINQLDLRLTKSVKMGASRLQVMFDCYNALNASPILSQNNTYGPVWLQPTQILSARLFKIGLQASF